MAKSTYLSNKILDHSLGTATFTKPTAVYLSLHTASPGPNGAVPNEVSGGSYARQALTASAAASASTSNSNAINFTNMPACTITYWGIWDASTAGNLLFYGALTSSKTVNSGDTESVAIGAGTFAEA